MVWSAMTSFLGYRDGSAVSAFAVVPSDTTVFAATRAVYVGVTGDIALRMSDGSLVTLVAVPAGSLLPISADKIMATNTTATSMVGFS